VPVPHLRPQKARDVRRRFLPSLVNFFRRYLPLACKALIAKERAAMY